MNPTEKGAKDNENLRGYDYRNPAKTVEVEAASRTQAQELVERKWNDSEYILDAEAFVGVDFSAREKNAIGIMNADLFRLVAKCSAYGANSMRYTSKHRLCDTTKAKLVRGYP